MDAKWIQNRFKMDPKWIQHGSKMNAEWIQNGSEQIKKTLSKWKYPLHWGNDTVTPDLTSRATLSEQWPADP